MSGAPFEKLVSVIIPVFNGAGFLLPSLQSAREAIAHAAGRRPDVPPEAFEIILCDDASTDGSLQQIKEAVRDDPQVRVVAHPVNRGAGAARNTAIQASSGEILFFLDVGDAFFPPHVDRCLDVLSDKPEFGLVKTGIATAADVDLTWLAQVTERVVFNTAIRRECHDAVGGFPEDPELRVLRLESSFYCEMVQGVFLWERIPEATVLHKVRPGSVCDVRRESLRARGDTSSPLTPAQLEVLPILMDRQRDRLMALGIDDVRGGTRVDSIVVKDD
ncbi:glycosyltransferase family 2 protein [Phaeovibrio sulfidiphilus]|uniref:Glycosyltransferase family 2 protein n=1 Tax=Phaeovibrio sulfidiphilus TaxID=1220600 RepID=A0A8J6YPV6_9PROT|nr:glycosyltransferase family 2 protein [Phaeovibrio sulfidiphilus]MBE1237481.1 glycosyltransferase family 2 protein [Phaeovibrio sulfidiphilus]